MGGFEINQAARIIRAGNELSKTNKKLRDAVCSFIEWFFEVVAKCQLPAGWNLEKENDRQIRLDFETRMYGWYSVTTNSDEEQMNAIIMCCRVLAGPKGEKLIAWLEKQVKERNQMLSKIQTIPYLTKDKTTT